jgi:hypothetical protein
MRDFLKKNKNTPQTTFLQHPPGAPSRTTMNESKKITEKGAEALHRWPESEKWCNGRKFSGRKI